MLSLGQLAHETGASYPYLREIVARRRDAYQSFTIPKRSGGFRSIAAPEPMLMDVHRWILKNLLDDLPRHPASFAYHRDVSIVACASQHRGARWLLKMDLHDFFDTVKEEQVYRAFRRRGYRKLMAFELARITTRAEKAQHAPWHANQFRIREYSVTASGRLPQGAPTSGQLANAAASRLDRLLSAYAAKHRLVYTRYSDDLTFSGLSSFERETALRHAHAISGLVHAAGFLPHHSKTRIVPPGARHIVLGLLVEDEVRLLPEHARRIESHLRGGEKFGLANHSAHRGFDSVLSFANYLDGWIAFAMGVEQTRALVWRRRLWGVLSAAGIPAPNLERDGRRA